MNMWLGGYPGQFDHLRTSAELKNSSETVALTEAIIETTASYGHVFYTSAFPYTLYGWVSEGSTGAPKRRHNGGANWTFADGHAKYFKEAAGPMAKYANGGDPYGEDDPMWNPNASE
ncbi:MAG: hypothetical protein IJS60_07430 [Abditibacteriota bacterium]|nr:hypothetical protein [Abditibacteriota bacterium]